MSHQRKDIPTCRICGKAVPPRHRWLCGSVACKLESQREYQHRYRWHRDGHEGEPPPRPAAPTTCSVCGRPLNNQWGNYQLSCSDFCKRVRQAERMLAYYYRHRERHLERQRGYREKKKAGR